MNQVSDRLAALAPSQTLAMSQKSSELKAQGVDVINLSVGEPDFNTPQHIKDAAKKAIDDNFSHYSPVPGYMDLRQAICAKLKNENGLDFTPEQIVVSNGAKQSICNTILALVNPGDEVILPAPYWVSYVEMVKLAEGKNVIIETGIEQDFKMTPAQLEAAITPKTKLLILCSPSNPTGSVYSREELEALASVLERHPQVFVISDEIYEHINYVGAHQSLAQFPSIRERIVIINGVSKGYAMTGWRIGYAAGPENVIRNMVKLQENVSACAATPCQVAAIEALEGPQDHLKYMVEQYRLRRDYVMRRISEIPGLSCHAPAGTFYAFIDISQLGMPCEEFAMKLLEERQVVVVPGTAFGEFGEGYIRLSYATSMQCLEQGLQELEEFVRSHETEGDPA